MGNRTDGDTVIPPFCIGQKVICVYNEAKGSMPRTSLKKGKIYTVAAVFPPSFKEWGVRLVEVKSSLGFNGAYKASRFAPIQKNFQAITYKQITEHELASVN